MGRQNRQSKRIRERQQERQTEKGSTRPAASSRSATGSRSPANSSSRGSSLPIIGLIAFAVAAVVVFAFFAFRGQNAAAPSVTPTPLSVAAVADHPGKVDGIPCYNEMLNYHVHSHLTVLVHGQQLEVPAYIGISQKRQCLYWLHTHDATGIIHVEGPHKFDATLGKFFDIWGQPLNRHQIANVTVPPGAEVRIFVNKKQYTGDPRKITLTDQKSITIEIGKPFSPPTLFDFSVLNRP